jgi:two-component system response regulator YesN
MDHRVQLIIAIMEKNYHRDVSIKSFASKVNLSVSYFCHLFKRETGSCPKQYLKSLRMRRARALLETTPLSAKEIMNSVGISNSSHFARDFKKSFGLTPIKFRTGARPKIQEDSARG